MAWKSPVVSSARSASWDRLMVWESTNAVVCKFTCTQFSRMQDRPMRATMPSPMETAFSKNMPMSKPGRQRFARSSACALVMASSWSEVMPAASARSNMMSSLFSGSPNKLSAWPASPMSVPIKIAPPATSCCLWVLIRGQMLWGSVSTQAQHTRTFMLGTGIPIKPPGETSHALSHSFFISLPRGQLVLRMDVPVKRLSDTESKRFS
mmetsp:Transcript_97019/g.269977  ORF Transcript_97019/g.269977 Transcript_97019/m.269977 type:complete len:208 (-) Transcript_97019:775-1398(-)